MSELVIAAGVGAPGHGPGMALQTTGTLLSSLRKEHFGKIQSGCLSLTVVERSMHLVLKKSEAVSDDQAISIW